MLPQSTNGQTQSTQREHVDQLAFHVGVLASLTLGFTTLAAVAGVDLDSLMDSIMGLAPASPSALARCLIAMGHATRLTE